MAPPRFLQLLTWGSALLLCGATIVRFVLDGGPFFTPPMTVVDHVSPAEHETRDALLLLPKVEPLIPRGATVAVFRPLNGQSQNDHSSYLTAVGLLPHHFVLPPFAAGRDTSPPDLVQFVVAVEEPFEHPAYDQVAAFDNGFLYEVRR